jgi:protein-disulfide isomerase
MCRRLLPAALVLALAACVAPVAEDATTVSGACAVDPAAGGRGQFDDAVRTYLLEHGDVLVQALQKTQARQQAAAQARAKQALAENRAALFGDPSDPAAGAAADAPGTVVVVEFFDNQCPYCKKLAPDLARLIGNGRVRLIYKEFPILGAGSETAARAALASLAQGKYTVFHDALMADATPEHQLREAHLMSIARSVGLNAGRLSRDMVSPAISAKIAANRALAQSLGIGGTPALVIGDRVVPAAMTYEAMMRAVTEARERVPAASDAPR